MPVEHLVGADGTITAPSGRFHDELLNVDCFPEVASDGVTRCLPNFPWPQIPVFADATCTTPLVRIDASSCWNPPYFFRAGDQFVTVAGEYSRSGPVFRRDYGSQKCEEARRSPRQKYFTLGEEVPPAKFAAFTKRTQEVHVPPGGDGDASATGAPATSGSRIALVTEQFVGPDGVATTPREHFRDEKLEVDCTPGLASDGVMRCLPSPGALPAGGHFGGETAFADPSCTIPLARGLNPRKHPVPPYAVTYTNVVAGIGLPHFHRLLGEYPKTAPVFNDFTGRCIEAERSPLRGYFNVGPEVAPSEFVEFTKRTVSTKGAPGRVGVAPMSGSRISVTKEQLIGADGTVTTPTNIRYRDEKLGTDCWPRPAADGITRCIPTDVVSTDSPGSFADAACTNPLATVLIRDGRGIPSYALQETKSAAGTCEIKRLHVFFLGPEHGATQPVFFAGFDSAGSPTCTTARNNSYRYFPLGTEVPPTEFVAFVKSEGANRALRGRRKPR